MTDAFERPTPIKHAATHSAHDESRFTMGSTSGPLFRTEVAGLVATGRAQNPTGDVTVADGNDAPTFGK